MSTIILRADVSRELSATELDENFRELKKHVSTGITETGKGSYTPNMETTEGIFTYILTEDTVINAPINATAGKRGIITIEQDLIGGHKCYFYNYLYWRGGPVDKKSSNISVFSYNVGDNSVVFLKLIYSGPQQ